MDYQDDTTFKPNTTPTEVIQAGAFGGSYFGIAIDDTEDDYTDLFQALFAQVPTEFYLLPKYSAKANKFKIRSGKDYKYWKKMKWINYQDPRGWFQWYCNYSLGRRCSDDERQMGRWNDFCGVNGRWRNNIYGRIHTTGDWDVSPRIQQSLFHWGYQVNKHDYELWLSSKPRTRNLSKTLNKLYIFNKL